MDYYARLVELLALLPPDAQSEAVKLAELLAASAAQPLPAPPAETPVAPAADETPRE